MESTFSFFPGECFSKFICWRVPLKIYFFLKKGLQNYFWAHLCTLHGGLICIALHLFVTRQKLLDNNSFNHLTGNVQGSRSKVKWVKLGLKVMILAGGLTPTSSCIFLDFLRPHPQIINGCPLNMLSMYGGLSPRPKWSVPAVQWSEQCRSTAAYTGYLQYRLLIHGCRLQCTLCLHEIYCCGQPWVWHIFSGRACNGLWLVETP